MRARQAISILIIEATALWLLTACRQTPVTEPGFIRYEMDRIPYRIVNRSSDGIEVLNPEQFYRWSKVGWQRDYWCISCVGIPDEFFKIGNFVSGASEWPDKKGPGVYTCSADRKCDYFVTRRYRLPESPGHLSYTPTKNGWETLPARKDLG